jgi:hypothetical protein
MIKINPTTLITDFVQVACLAGIRLSETDIVLQVLAAPHAPSSGLPENKMAVYVFSWGDQCLKVGKVGPNSEARYTSQHYNPKSSNSNLAKSILKNKMKLGLAHLDETNVGEWIMKETDRINFLIEQKLGIPVLSLLESFLQCRLKPRFEGFESQIRIAPRLIRSTR